MGQQINLGDEVRDRVTGYKGIVVCVAEWLNGCRRLLVQAEGLQESGQPIEAVYVDEPQLELVERGAFTPRPAEQLPTGGPAPVPTRPTAPTRQ